ncbi:autotransporter domain-containing protein [Mesorhizobium sp. M7A.F.Ca.CA.001.10.2.1]|uniref:autotransporter domain-containing protein n=1 Tax=Mesorhizobium sp. M7A.F.Ca.CA.001.10.2.1 TaxID=2496720 RepID=UPI0013E28B1E|nr:autotransporter domain-containing protein [Mesorhizobium sp. M7A.F.Ca.CA.001.10.2.1]
MTAKWFWIAATFCVLIAASLNASAAAEPIVISPATLPDGRVGEHYDRTLMASGGAGGPYTFALTSGVTPVSFSSGGVLSGAVIAAPGTYNFRVLATDQVGNTGTRDYTIVIADNPVLISPAALPGGQIGQPYNQALTASGGAGGPYTFSIVSGSMPVAFSSAGVLSGPVIAAPGVYSFRVRATDHVGNSGEHDYTIVIADNPVVISPAALPGAQIGQPYSQALTASGGAGGPFTFSIVSGSMPVAFSSAGVLSGPVIAVPGVYSFRIRATDHVGNNGERDYTLAITTGPPIVISPAALPNGQVGQPYSQMLTATGGVGAPYTFQRIIGNLPEGVSLATDGTLGGTPTESGSFAFAVDVFDTSENRARREYTLDIAAAPRPTAPSLTMTIVAGMSASLPLTPGATGEPFSAAAIMSSAPAEGGTATLSGAPNYLLTFASSPVFSGTVIVTYTLTGPGGVSDPATVTITVTTRPDPSDDPEVAGLLNAQAQAVQQFAAGQTDNINHRMGALRSEACRKAFANGLELSGQGADGNAASVDFPDGSDCGGEAAKLGFGLWAGGHIDLGHSSPDDSAERDSVSINMTTGIDYRFNDRFVAGLAVGYSSDDSDIGGNGTESSGEAYSATLYASYRPAENLFLDALAGYGSFSFDSKRFVTSVGGFADGQRDGDQIFGSLTAGFDHSVGGLRLTPFARLTTSSSSLDAFTETGAGIYSLSFGKQSVDSLGGTLGLAGGYDMPVALGVFTPRFRFEYTHEFSGSSDVDIRYADSPDGLVYGFQTQPLASDQVMIGLGADLLLHQGLSIGLDYRGTIGFQDSYSHAFGLRVGGGF